MTTFDMAVRCAEGGAISGATAFDLWETSGFPLDLTQLMAEEDGLAVDVPGYEAAMEAAREKSRAGNPGAAICSLCLTAASKSVHTPCHVCHISWFSCVHIGRTRARTTCSSTLI